MLFRIFAKVAKPYYLHILFLLIATYFKACESNIEISRNNVLEKSCTEILGDANTNYTNFISRDAPITYIFRVNKFNPRTTHLRVEATASQYATYREPVLLAIRQRRRITTMEVPYRFDESATVTTGPNPLFYFAARTLCIDLDEERDTTSMNVTVQLTTQSLQPISFSLKLKFSEDMQLSIDKAVTFNVAPTTPTYFRFPFPVTDMSMVKIKASSKTTDGSANCLTMSVQSLDCPVYDLGNNVRFQGVWQSMSTVAALNVEKEGKYSNGFALVFVAHSNDETCLVQNSLSTSIANDEAKNFTISQAGQFLGFPCQQKTTSQGDPRCKRLTVTITDESNPPWSKIVWCLLIPVIFTLGIALFAAALYRYRHEWIVSLLRDFQPKPSDNNNSAPKKFKTKGWRWKADLSIADFSSKEFDKTRRMSRRFYWTVSTVAMFYAIPVYQLVLYYLEVQYTTGDYSICYYNYLCAQRVGYLTDFNHFWSNISYVLLGALFILIVRRRSKNLYMVRLVDSADRGEAGRPKGFRRYVGGFSKAPVQVDYGVPQHYGVFYSLGFALAMEGFLSAAYHLCPNQSTFQFDTCFMYIIAVLLLLKIYQFRHPVHLGANKTFAILGSITLIAVLGIIFGEGTEKTVFLAIFLPLQYIVIILVLIYFCVTGSIRNKNGELVTDFLSVYVHLGKSIKRGEFGKVTKRINGGRLILPVLILLICILATVYTIVSDQGFASYLLYLFIGNVLVMTLYYVGIMKPIHGEFKNYTWVQPTLYFVAAAVVGGFSLRYFTDAPYKASLSAAHSRDKNEECLHGWFPFYPYYDNHDAWHFLSAAALFLAFMGLLIVDDDLITTHQSEIPVF